ncbi:MAG: lysozyme inhibitor LprI family protein [Flavihumibacter sp.]|nr:lysozyme inhibitor LprI family protein [Flavihumibacter sp.]
MIKKISATLIFLISICAYSFSQGHIEHIKNQQYMNHQGKIHCGNLSNDNLSERVCANLAFQKSDSLLIITYDSLLKVVKTYHSDNFKLKLEKMQQNWRKMRDSHCGIIYDSYENCGACHSRSIAYLNCLKELTDNRIKELKKLKLNISEE